jgi:4-hydroxymandelate oxidase
MALTATSVIPDSLQALTATTVPSATVGGPLLCLQDYRRAAQQAIPVPLWDFIEAGTGDEVTVRRNREAFAGIKLVPQRAEEGGSVNVGLKLLGAELRHPILLAPTAAHGLLHVDGEIATAQGARDAGAGMVVSMYASQRVEEIAPYKPPLFWFQLYMQERSFTAEIVHRVTSSGCTAICIGSGSPYASSLESANRGFTLPNALPNVRLASPLHHMSWKDVEWLRSISPVPVVVKGILHPQDAERAIQAGADAIIVSNDGGRGLDTSIATIEALPRIADQVRWRLPILLDGGIRRGTDVVKAIAMGAQAVLIGRPVLYGLAVNGAEGVAAVIDTLRHELEAAVQAIGARSLSMIDSSVLFT